MTFAEVLFRYTDGEFFLTGWGVFVLIVSLIFLGRS